MKIPLQSYTIIIGYQCQKHKGVIRVVRWMRKWCKTAHPIVSFSQFLPSISTIHGCDFLVAEKSAISHFYGLIYNRLEMENIDKMTMELLMNKRKYNKYISKNDPEKYNKQQQEFARIRKYASRILSLTEDLLNDPDMEVQSDVNHSFLDYVKTCNYHFETKDMELAGCKDSYEGNDDDDNTMFDTCADAPEKQTEDTPRKESQSYWGKSIHKVSSSRVDAYFNRKNI